MNDGWRILVWWWW